MISARSKSNLTKRQEQRLRQAARKRARQFADDLRRSYEVLPAAQFNPVAHCAELGIPFHELPMCL